MSAGNAKFMDKGRHFGNLNIPVSIRSTVVVQIVSASHIWGGFGSMHVNSPCGEQKTQNIIKCKLGSHRLSLDDS